MNPSVQNVSLEEVERAIRDGVRLPRFAPALEQQFQVDSSDNRCKHIIRTNYIGLVVYHCFLYGDYRTIGDVFALDLWMHFGVMTPLMLGINIILAYRPPSWLREGLEAFGTVVLALTILIVVSSSRMPDRDSVLFSMALAVLFAVVMQKIQFLHCVVACAIMQIFFSIGLMDFPEFSANRVVMLNFIMFSAIVFSLVGSYNLDREHRLGYLLTLRDRFRNCELEIASLRDALTGVGNRRALDAALMRRRAADSARLSTVCLLDIDHFKAFNDVNGHQEGDACLKRVAGLVAATVREGEGAVYRFGGEEFLVLLDGSSHDEALIVAERVRSTVAGARIPRDPTGTTFVTVSIGVASGCLGREVTSEALIAAADAALYRAKHDGRDRVRSAPHAADDASALEERVRQPLVA